VLPQHSAVRNRMPDTRVQTINEEAAEWLVRMAEGPLTSTEQATWQQWHDRSAHHAEAWSRAETVLHKLVQVPKPLALPILHDAGRSRRAALARIGKLMLGAAAVPLAWQAWQSNVRRALQADQCTASGEQRTLRLTNDVQILLNTASALDTPVQGEKSLLRLYAGEVLVDAQQSPQPLSLASPHGILEAHAARFAVRVWPHYSQLVVVSGSLSLETQPNTRIRAGEQLRFSNGRFEHSRTDLDAALAWTHGLLLADQMRLDDLAAELARYRKGVIDCDPHIAALHVSGTFPVGSAAATERSFAMLADIHPIEINLRAAGLWVTWRALPENNFRHA